MTETFAFENLLLKYGIIRFGRFADGKGEWMPFKLNLDWMVSYPDVLKATAFDVRNHFQVHSESIDQFERILCPVDALPVATLVSAETGIPVVYSCGQGEPAVDDLVGAYDINHPTLLLTSMLYPEFKLGTLTRRAERVGLRVRYVLELVERIAPLSDPWQDEDSYASGMVTAVGALALMAKRQALITEAQETIVNKWLSNRFKNFGSENEPSPPKRN